MKAFSGQAVLRMAVSFIALGVIVYLMRDKLLESLVILKTEVAWSWFVIGAATYCVALGILTVRLQCFLKAQHVRMSFGETFYLNLVGLFFNLFLPSAVGGDIAKIYYAAKHSGKKMESATSVILDRLIGFVASISMAVLAVLLFGKEFKNPRIHQMVYTFLAVTIFVMIFFSSKKIARRFRGLAFLIPFPKWRHKLSDLYHIIHGFKHHRLLLVLSMALSFAGQGLIIIVYYWLAVSLGSHLNLWIFFVLVPMIFIVSMAPSMGGLGVREAGVIYFFNRFMPAERALALSLLLDILIYGFSFAGGIAFSLRGGRLSGKAIHEMEKLE